MDSAVWSPGISRCPGCDSSSSRTDAPDPAQSVGATETFGVGSEAQMLLHCFNVDTFHYLLSLHDSSILSFHFVVERLELQREAGTGPETVGDLGE